MRSHDEERTAIERRRKMGWRRATSLLVVHLLVVGHVVHSLNTDSTLSPLEPSEAGHAISEGVVNAGAIFLALTILSTIVFGRFFCGWACHVVAYQDAARWLLLRIGIRPRPLRSRLLALIPFFAAYWLFGQPVLLALQRADASPVSIDLTTTDFWRTFPGPVVACLTFLVCGFVVVYVLGSKGFCSYGCPYGAIFGVADRFARGRIRVKPSCQMTGECTRACSSNVDVAAEVARFGQVVDGGCMKCLDCVCSCPNDALFFGFGPAPTASSTKNYPAPTRDTSALDWKEECFVASTFSILFMVFYGLYRTIPFLLAIGLSLLFAVALLTMLRLFYADRVELQNSVLRSGATVTAAGKLYAAAMVPVALFLCHSSFIQWHYFQGAKALESASGDPQNPAVASMLDNSRYHFELVDRWGLFDTSGMDGTLGELALRQGRPEDALPLLLSETERSTQNHRVRLHLGDAWHALGRTNEALRTYQDVLDPRTASPSDYAALARALNDHRPHVAEREVLLAGLEAHAGNLTLTRLLCRLLVECPDEGLRDITEAVRRAEVACRQSGNRDIPSLEMLAWLYSKAARHDDALETSIRALDLAKSTNQAERVPNIMKMIASYREAADEF